MEKMKVSGMRLGRQIPKIAPHLNPDPKILKLADYVPPLPAQAPYVNWEKWASKQLGGDNNFGMMANDSLGDCTCAAVGHAIQVVTGATEKVVTPTDAEVIKMYEQSGYVPGDESTDNGWMIQSALQYWQTTGLAGHKIAGMMALDPHNPAHVDLAIELFGFVDIGVLLPISAQSQNGIWTVPEGGPTGNGAPASWGGHSVVVTTRSPFRRELITWGQGGWRVSPNFWKDYVDECWCCFTFDWIERSGKSPSGFDKAALLSDMNALGLKTH